MPGSLPRPRRRIETNQPDSHATSIRQVPRTRLTFSEPSLVAGFTIRYNSRQFRAGRALVTKYCHAVRHGTNAIHLPRLQTRARKVEPAARTPLSPQLFSTFGLGGTRIRGSTSRESVW